MSIRNIFLCIISQLNCFEISGNLDHVSWVLGGWLGWAKGATPPGVFKATWKTVYVIDRPIWRERSYSLALYGLEIWLPALMGGTLQIIFVLKGRVWEILYQVVSEGNLASRICLRVLKALLLKYFFKKMLPKMLKNIIFMWINYYSKSRLNCKYCKTNLQKRIESILLTSIDFWKSSLI